MTDEIGQAFHLWVEEGTIELLLAALDDPDDKVARRAVKLLTGCVRQPAAKERKEISEDASRQSGARGWGQASAWMTPRGVLGSPKR